MDPQIALNRGYWEDAGDCRNQWIAAYKEIAKKHLMLANRAQKMIKRIKLACSLCVTHATFYNTGNVDDCFLGEAIARENEYLVKNKQAYKSLDGDFPCGNEDDIRFARRFFSIHEMAFIQMGFASMIDPDDLSLMPPIDKPFADEAFPVEITTDDQLLGRKGFIHECLGHYKEAINCYEAFAKGRPHDRILDLRNKLAEQQ